MKLNDIFNHFIYMLTEELKILSTTNIEYEERLRHFKVEVTENIWGKQVKWIQRDTPLTDEELKLITNKR